MQKPFLSVLTKELHDDEPKWTNFSKETEIMKKTVADSILDTLIDEIAEDLCSINSKMDNNNNDNKKNNKNNNNNKETD